jgi:uncharacterized membrane protein
MNQQFEQQQPEQQQQQYQLPPQQQYYQQPPPQYQQMPPQYQNPYYQQPPPQYYHQPIIANEQGKAIASMVLGIVTLVFLIMPFFNMPALSFFGLITAIVGILLGDSARRNLKRAGVPAGMAIAGVVMCAIPLILVAIGLLALVISLVITTI